jgi:hypothetical protein
MSVSRPVLAIAGAALAGVALVGGGTGATFTTSTTSSQRVTAGTLHVAVSAPGAECASSDASGCHALVLPGVGPVGSTFETAPTVVTMTNTGNIPAFFDAIQMSATRNGDDASAYLLNQMSVCIHSTDTTGTWVEGNGPLAVATTLSPTVKENPVKLMPGDTATYSVDFYAGKDSACGATYSDGPHTSALWQTAVGHAYQTPDSLTNKAQGGVVTPTLGFSFTG